jgi:NarL family two-component system response regulator LiaR
VRILVVEDADVVREAVVASLTRAGHEVVGEAIDGWQGVQEALACRPDVVVTNWQMRHMDGIEATRRIREVYPEPAIVALTSTGDEIECDAFLEAGADACVDKCDLPGALLVALEKLERGRARRFEDARG